MQNSHPIIDLADFEKEFSLHMDPAYPGELSFWATAGDTQKAAAMRANPDLWRTGQGKFYMDALSRVRSINARNRYWLPILEKEMKANGDQLRLQRVQRCLNSYKDTGEREYREFAATAAGNQAEHETAWEE